MSNYRITKDGHFDRRYKGAELDQAWTTLLAFGLFLIVCSVFPAKPTSETSNTQLTHSQPVTSIQQPKVPPIVIEQPQPVIVTEEVKSDPVVLTEDQTVSDEESQESDDSVATVYDRKFKPWD